MTVLAAAAVAGFMLALVTLVTYALLGIEMPRRVLIAYVALDLTCLAFLTWATVLGLTA